MFTFKRKPLVSEDMADWIEDCFDWFAETFTQDAQLILPTKEFFVTPRDGSAEMAHGVASEVARYIGFDGPIVVEPLQMVAAEYRHNYQDMSDIAGTFQSADGVAHIQYDPELLNHPIRFISTMAHEVVHALLEDHVSQMPGGEGAHELATDLGCIIQGFGLFQLQAADDAGWSGYLSQGARAFALATYLRRHSIAADVPEQFLSTRCKKLLRRAIAETKTSKEYP